MPKGYQHLTRDQRCQLYTLLERGDSVFTIAKVLDLHRSTIYRELERNSGKQKYRYKQANKKATDRRQVGYWDKQIHGPYLSHFRFESAVS